MRMLINAVVVCFNDLTMCNNDEVRVMACEYAFLINVCSVALVRLGAKRNAELTRSGVWNLSSIDEFIYNDR